MNASKRLAACTTTTFARCNLHRSKGPGRVAGKYFARFIAQVNRDPRGTIAAGQALAAR